MPAFGEQTVPPARNLVERETCRPLVFGEFTMLGDIDSSFTMLAKGHPASQAQIDTAVVYFGSLPQDFIDLVREATEVELQHRNGQYVRIWGPMGCINMDEAYGIRKRIPNAIPIGDDGGGHVLFFANGKQGEGLYHVGYGNLDLDDAIWIAESLGRFLAKAVGIETF